jgi:hypothetical protein
MSEKFTLLVQGPLKPCTVSNWIKHKENSHIKDIVISTWVIKDQQEEPITKHDDDYIIVYNKEPLCSSKYSERHFANFYKQIKSMINGLELIKTPYVIKARCDEYYENITPLIDNFIEHDLLMNSTDFITRKYSYSPVHMSDHLFIAKTKELLISMKKLYHDLMNEESCSIYIDSKTNKKLAVESIISKYYFQEFGISTTTENKEILKTKIHIIPVELFGKYSLSYNTAKKTYTSKKDISVILIQDNNCFWH